MMMFSLLVTRTHYPHPHRNPSDEDPRWHLLEPLNESPGDHLRPSQDPSFESHLKTTSISEPKSPPLLAPFLIEAWELPDWPSLWVWGYLDLMTKGDSVMRVLGLHRDPDLLADPWVRKATSPSRR